MKRKWKQSVLIEEHYQNGKLIKRTANGFLLPIYEDILYPDKPPIVKYYVGEDNLGKFYTKK